MLHDPPCFNKDGCSVILHVRHYHRPVAQDGHAGQGRGVGLGSKGAGGSPAGVLQGVFRHFRAFPQQPFETPLLDGFRDDLQQRESFAPQGLDITGAHFEVGAAIMLVPRRALFRCQPGEDQVENIVALRAEALLLVVAHGYPP